MAEGYATFAANGVHHDWYVIEEVSDPNGLRYEHKLEADRAFTPADGEQRDVRARAGRRRTAPAPRRRRWNGRPPARPARRRSGRPTTSTSRRRGSSATPRSWPPRSRTRAATATTRSSGYLEPFFGARLPDPDVDGVHGARARRASRCGTSRTRLELHGENPTYSPPPDDVRADHDDAADHHHDADHRPRRRPRLGAADHRPSRRPRRSRRRRRSRRPTDATCSRRPGVSADDTSRSASPAAASPRR